MKNLVILGSTGSIGTNTLNVVRLFPARFKVLALAAGRNTDLLAEQVGLFEPELAVVLDKEAADRLKGQLRHKRVRIVHGQEGYREAASLATADLVVSAMVGAAGLLPTLAAIEAGKSVALANKETLVMAGGIVMEEALRRRVAILPVDSEHSAIFQCLRGNERRDVRRIFLTASGGPFLNRPAGSFHTISPLDALNHPTWRMGPKITIDSATLMNKGLEVIEAKWLFDVPVDVIQVLIHPESVIHSMVAYHDGAIIAQMGVPDMKGAIAYALSYPERLALDQPLPDLAGMGRLTFQDPDWERFPCLSLAFGACRVGGTSAAVLNAANEVAVQAFLESQVPFSSIPAVIERTLEKHQTVSRPTLADILDADAWARTKASELCRKMSA